MGYCALHNTPTHFIALHKDLPWVPTLDRLVALSGHADFLALIWGEDVGGWSRSALPPIADIRGSTRAVASTAGWCPAPQAKKQVRCHKRFGIR
jgi:hypothetical protein